MTFKLYFDHTEPIFNYLKILNLFKLNEYLTSLFMFRYFQLQVTKISIVILQETHHCYTKNVIEQIMKKAHLPIMESMCGIIFLRNINKLDLFQYSNRQSKNIFLILIKIIIEPSTQSKIKTKLL
jgi:hypothetical protein